MCQTYESSDLKYGLSTDFDCPGEAFSKEISGSSLQEAKEKVANYPGLKITEESNSSFQIICLRFNPPCVITVKEEKQDQLTPGKLGDCLRLF